MVTFIFVVAVAAFIPYVAAPGIQNGVKAITAHQSADAGVENTFPAALKMPDGGATKDIGAADAGTTDSTIPATADRKGADSQG